MEHEGVLFDLPKERYLDTKIYPAEFMRQLVAARVVGAYIGRNLAKIFKRLRTAIDEEDIGALKKILEESDESDGDDLEI
jgi:hypothetical protein